MSRIDDLLVPDMRRLAVNDKPCLLAQLPLQGGENGLTTLHTPTGRRPHDDRTGRLRKDEPAQQDTVALIENDCPDRTTQPHQGPRRMLAVRPPPALTAVHLAGPHIAGISLWSAS